MTIKYFPFLGLSQLGTQKNRSGSISDVNIFTHLIEGQFKTIK